MGAPKISAVFHLAADKYLAPTEAIARAQQNLFYSDDPKHRYMYPEFSETYSCCAVYDAITELMPVESDGVCTERNEFRDILNKGMQAMGLDTTSMHAYAGYPGSFEEIQGARYLWLKWAALMAENQGN